MNIRHVGICLFACVAGLLVFSGLASAQTSDWIVCASEGEYCTFAGTIEVRYGATGSYSYKTLTDGTPCTNAVFGDPAPNVMKRCATRATSTSPSLSPPTSSYGPLATITCPAGAVDIWPGQYIQGIVNAYRGTTTFCLRAGVHSLTSSIRPKTNNTFVGEFGAILDGTGYWTINDGTQAAFRAHNEDIDYVTIRNLVIRNMPQQGIHAYYWMSDHWTIEYNEIASNKSGLEIGPNFTIRNNYIHHNVGNSSSSNPADRGGAYGAVHADNTTFDSNEIAYNGLEQKVVLSANVTFRNNFVHHNLGAAIRNNTLRRNAGDAVMISMSQNVQIYNNTLDANFGGIEYFLNCDVLSGGHDLKNNATYDNTIVVAQSSLYATGFSSTLCTAAQLAPYLNGSKILIFSRNTYVAPSAFGRYWLWDNLKFWNEWQALGQDVSGSLSP